VPSAKKTRIYEKKLQTLLHAFVLSNTKIVAHQILQSAKKAGIFEQKSANTFALL